MKVELLDGGDGQYVCADGVWIRYVGPAGADLDWEPAISEQYYNYERSAYQPTGRLSDTGSSLAILRTDTIPVSVGRAADHVFEEASASSWKDELEQTVSELARDRLTQSSDESENHRLLFGLFS